MTAAEEISEINSYFEKRMAESKKIWMTRGRDARIAAATKRAAEGTSWRQMKGLPLFFHELKHVGNRPFSIGFGVSALIGLWAQTKFTDDMKKDSLYWSSYHGGK